MKKFTKIIHTGIIGILLACACGLGMLYYLFNTHCIDFSVLEQYNRGAATVLLDDSGIEWARFQLDKQLPISLEHMSPHLINAFLAAEDWQFFSHQGISVRGIIRSIFVNIYNIRKVQGASTITQQLVKLLFFDQTKAFSRKIKEQVLALMIERQFTKQYILQTYLNHVYFGCGIYGVQAASQRFWGINASELTIEQSATLAAIVRSPGRYCPILYPLSCQKRRNTILERMLHRNIIDNNTYTQTRARPITIIAPATSSAAPHLLETIRIFLEHTVGKDILYKEGCIVQTTINALVQAHAQTAFNTHIKHLKKTLSNATDGALITMDTKTGEIKALVGGYNFAESQYNRALQAHRQMGSVLKPLIYAAAINNGAQLSQTEYDEPFSLQQPSGIWTPKNYNKKFSGQVTLAYALSRSSNIVAIKTLLATGAHHVVELAKQCQLQGPFHTYPSLALGCIDGTLLEVAGMFNIFARNGTYIEPHYIKWVKDISGNKIFNFRPKEQAVLSSRVSDQVAQVLQLGLKRLQYQYKPHEWINSEAISKTGTTNDSRTCWFIGSTPCLTTAVYVGYDNNQPMGEHVFPVKTAFPIWLALHRSLVCSQKSFIFDPNLKTRYINEYTGHACSATDAHAIKILA